MPWELKVTQVLTAHAYMHVLMTCRCQYDEAENKLVTLSKDEHAIHVTAMLKQIINEHAAERYEAGYFDGTTGRQANP